MVSLAWIPVNRGGLFRFILPAILLCLLAGWFTSYWMSDDPAAILHHFMPTSQRPLVFIETDASLVSAGLARKDLDKEDSDVTTHKSFFGEIVAKWSKFSGSDLQDSIPNVRVHEADCAKLFKDDQKAISEALAYQTNYPHIPVPDEAYSQMTVDCAKFRQDRHYISQPLSDEEAEFPIAFSIMMFKDVEQTERLLRAIYHPQNYYCIHVDKKSTPAVRQSMEGIARCFDNVFMASSSVDVQWAWFSVLEPDLICMEDLWKYKKWKYFINLTGQEFPLKTNRELVKILKVYNGANDMEGTVKRRNVERTQFVHQGFYQTNEVKSPVPVDVTLTKGSVHITASRDFVDFVLHDSRALEFREWVKDTGVPDETFFSSLNHSPQLEVPGAYLGEPETDPTKKPFITRFKNWGNWPFDWPCAGQRVRLICVFAIGDLPLLQSRPELFANKFHNDYHPLAYSCMEEWHFNKTREEVAGTREFDTSYYESLSFVHHHI